MKRIMMTRLARLTELMALCLLFSLLASTAFAQGKQDFTLHNETGKEIIELYLSPHDVDDWEEDVLGTDTLADGEAVKITFDREEKADSWDMKVVFSDDKSVVWTELMLSEITDITISFKDGKPYATWKNGE